MGCVYGNGKTCCEASFTNPNVRASPNRFVTAESQRLPPCYPMIPMVSNSKKIGRPTTEDTYMAVMCIDSDSCSRLCLQASRNPIFVTVTRRLHYLIMRDDVLDPSLLPSLVSSGNGSIDGTGSSHQREASCR